MKKTKRAILKKAKDLFNKHGVAAVSIREISREMGISHSNLIYHYKSKGDLLEALHQQILDNAIEFNNKIQGEDDAMKALFFTTIKGYEVLYDYRFFMTDLNLIMREHRVLHQIFLEVEEMRAQMYQTFIDTTIEKGLMRPPSHKNEYTNLITHIRIISDYWLSSAEIYDRSAGKRETVNRGTSLFLHLFYPYFTAKGRKAFDVMLLDHGLK